MPNKKVLITGSAGLIGSQSVHFFCQKDYQVIGIDNDMRSYFFGESASTAWNRDQLKKKYKNYKHYSVDIREFTELEKIFKKNEFDLVIHTAAQPSHDWAAKEPFSDFFINAVGTLNMLEATRKYCPQAVFIFTSTNKVYGDNPNYLPLEEKDTRYEISKKHAYFKGIDESMSIDNCVHSIFGVSKSSADLMVQEYGRYFKMKTAVFRGGCLTGPAHSAAQLHGFLAYLVNAIVKDVPYTIFGYKGKQVRDNIHAHDVVNAFYHFYKKPRKGEVYNMGGSRFSNVSVLEAIQKIENITGKKAKFKYSKKNRIGDHIWYISDTSKFQNHYPDWKYTYDGDAILEELCKFALDHNYHK
jgi:CDP-paratose 2-epimerase